MAGKDAARRGRTAPAGSLRQQAARGHLLGLARGPERSAARRRRIDRQSLDPLRRDRPRESTSRTAGCCRRRRPTTSSSGRTEAPRRFAPRSWNGPAGRLDEEPLGHGYKELSIPPADGSGGFRMEKNALHIWPRGEYMLIALPNIDGSFTVTLFLPQQGVESFQALTTPEAVDALFERRFADAIPAHAAPRGGLLRQSHRPPGDDPLRALVVRGPRARPRRCGARDRPLSRAGHERGVRGLQRLRSESPRSGSPVERGLRGIRRVAAGPTPTRSPTWLWRITSRCGRPSASRSSS